MRAILSTLLLLAATSASADWVRVVEASDVTYYVDPASVTIVPYYRRAYVIQDYAKSEPAGVRSRRVLYEIDCSGDGLRSLSATGYSEPMARGNSLDSWESTSPWVFLAPITGTHIPPRTPFGPIIKFVCSH